MIRKIRDNEQMFTNVINYLKHHQHTIEQRELAEMTMAEDMIHDCCHPGSNKKKPSELMEERKAKKKSMMMARKSTTERILSIDKSLGNDWRPD
jgi:hypothetical protein